MPKRQLLAKPGQNGQKEKPIDREQIQRLVDVGVKRATESFERDSRDFRQRLKREIDRLARQFTSVGTAIEPIGTTIASLSSAVAAEFKPIDNAKPGALLASMSLSGSTPERRSEGHARRDSRERPAAPSAGSGTLARSSQQILDAIAFYESIGQDSPSKRNVAGYCGINPALSTWRGAMAPLRAQGFVSESGETISLTAEGRAIARVEDVPSLSELHRQLLDKLSSGARRIAEELIQAHPRGIERDDLGVRAGIDPSISTWRGVMAELRKLGMVDQRGNEFIASDLLYPEGLA